MAIFVNGIALRAHGAEPCCRMPQFYSLSISIMYNDATLIRSKRRSLLALVRCSRRVYRDSRLLGLRAAEAGFCEWRNGSVGRSRKLAFGRPSRRGWGAAH